jgi:hypothetical protein
MREKIDKLLEWDKEKFVKLAQNGLITLIIALLIIRVISILSSFDYGDLKTDFDIIYKLIGIGASVLFYIGVLYFLLSLFTIAIYDKDLHIYLRVALIIALGLIISIPLYSYPIM